MITYINLEITEICRHILILTGKHNPYTEYTMEEKNEVDEMEKDIIKEIDWNGVRFTVNIDDPEPEWEKVILQLWDIKNLGLAIQSIIAIAHRYVFESDIEENMEEILNIIRLDSRLTTKEM